MMALTTPLFYVQATKEIARSQNNKGLVEASFKSKNQSSILTEQSSSSSVISSSISSSSTVELSSQNSSSSEISSSSLTLTNSSKGIEFSSFPKKAELENKDELTKKILKSIEDKKVENARKEELTKQIIKKETERIATVKAEEERKAAEAKRIEEEKKAAEEARIAEEKRVEAEKKAAEEKRVADEKAKELAAKLAAEAPKKVSTATAGSFSEAIDIQCANYGCNASQLKRIMNCESTGNPNAQNGIYTGLFQFHPQTFSANAARAGLSNPNIYNGYDQVATAAYMFANGQAGQWECK